MAEWIRLMHNYSIQNQDIFLITTIKALFTFGKEAIIISFERCLKIIDPEWMESNLLLDWLLWPTSENIFLCDGDISPLLPVHQGLSNKNTWLG